MPTRALGAPNDIQQTIRAYIDLTYPQAVGIRMLRHFLDCPHNDAGEGRGDRIEGFDLEPGHGEGISQLLRRKRRIAELAQPGLRKLHGQFQNDDVQRSIRRLTSDRQI